MRILDNIDPTTNEFNDFLAKYGIWFAIGIAIVILLIILVLILKNRFKKDDNKIKINNDSHSLLLALGNKENIIDHSFVGSRISLHLKDSSLINEEKLKSSGIDSIIKMSDKIILVVKGNAKEINDKLD